MSKSPSARGLSFFKVLFGDFGCKLQIPPAFVKNLGGLNGVFPLKYSMRDPGGRYWRVEINRCDSELYFDNGWKEFMEENSLEIGDFLVFRCNGSSEFSVRIYGKSGCQREVGFHYGMAGVDESKFTRRGGRNLGSKTQREGTGVAARLGSVKQGKGGNAGGQATSELSSQNGSRNQANLGAVHRKTKFTREFPPYRAVMRSACLRTGKMIMPSYLRNYAGHRQFIKLKSRNKIWIARFNMYQRVCMLGEGWLKFARENNLQKGNICIFEMINVDDVTLAVSISR